MSNPSSGLRFDVYERVHLPEDVAAIDELEEIELVPRIEIVQQGEQVLLKGHLLLTGVYRAPNELAGEQDLEHFIPVEITLPMNRINRLDDIAVEIDNFDVDLLSARTINITGVLSLLGIEMQQREQEEWREEPFTVIHKREEEAQGQLPSEQSQLAPLLYEEEQPADFAGWADPATQAFREQASRESAEREAAEREAAERVAVEREAAEREAAIREQRRREEEEVQMEQRRREAEEREVLAFKAAQQADAEREAAALRAMRLEEEERERLLEEEREDARQEAAEWEAYRQEEFRRQQAEQEEALSVYVQPDPLSEDPGEPDQEFSLTGEPSVNAADSPFAPQQSFDDPAGVQPDPEPKEMRVALGSKPSEDPSGQPAGNVGFRSLLQSSLREQEAKAVAEKDAQKAAEAANQPKDEEIEWKNLFFGRSDDDRSFRKLRMCIVQREETLETIAGRYQMQPREIALYNRLNDQSISEGQVLYIP
ncbi:LysM peptidoglycan-binding domain-containing protein [Paenibacillus nasutitermitis]|uniref:LysM domain-containing protein n=1 Tax=Paenibacillus nasutitermitis TaxID=1652958 RepID=A0A916YP45_9BACL|nr:LysM peptidoglycan-binding domain-containing protein [Paenibacillus nasutitermitis]GGD54537.1 hypothetical protein GCM10010911_10190 [Paenibacillus nasutitermitis]